MADKLSDLFIRKSKSPKPQSIRSAIPFAFAHLRREGEGDIFPFGRGLAGLSESNLDIARLVDSDIRRHQWKTPTQWLISRYPMKLRSVVRFSGIDMVLAEALIFACGETVEASRRPVSEKTVFSHRFANSNDGLLYQPGSWNAFAQKGMERACDSVSVLKLDIKDFYSSISHSILERSLIRTGLDAGYIDCIMGCVSAAAMGRNFGIPIGPHFAHLLAEAILVGLDDSLARLPVRFCRYLDDIHIFSGNDRDLYDVEKEVTAQLAAVGLNLNSEKTHVLESRDYLRLIDDGKLAAVSPEEAKLLKLRAELGGEYITRPSSEALMKRAFTKQEAERLIASLFDSDEIDLSRVARMLRVLRSCGIRAAAGPVIRRLHRALPLVTESLEFISSVVSFPEDASAKEKKALLEFYEHPYIRSNDYLQIMLLHIFRKISKGEAFESLVSRLPHLSDRGTDELRWL
jgi:hypothetical protein